MYAKKWSAVTAESEDFCLKGWTENDKETSDGG